MAMLAHSVAIMSQNYDEDYHYFQCHNVLQQEERILGSAAILGRQDKTLRQTPLHVKRQVMTVYSKVSRGRQDRRLR